MRYIAQAILNDDTGRTTIETVADSFKTDDYEATIQNMMKRHRHCNKYRYIAMDIATQEIVADTKKNVYYC